MSDKRFDREWFASGKEGRHGLANRLSDLHGFLAEDLSTKTAADIGCAEGHFCDFLANKFRKVSGYEKSESLFRVAMHEFGNKNNLSFSLFDIETTLIPENYDYIFLLGVLHYFNSEETRLKVLDGLLKRANEFLVLRTMFFENRITRGHSEETIRKKATYLSTIAQLAHRHDFRWIFIDNQYRGSDEYRLGDLVVMKRVADIKGEACLQFLNYSHQQDNAKVP